MTESSDRLGTAPPAPRFVIGRDKDIEQIRDRLLSGLYGSSGVVDINGEALRQAIENSGLTRAELVARVAMNKKGHVPRGALDTTRRTINHAENGSRIRDDFAKKLAQQLQIDLRTLRKFPPIRTVVAMHAPPGLGKTTVLQALCHDDTVRAALPDGTLWAPLGQKPDIPRILLQWGSSLGIREMQALVGSADDSTDLIRGILNATLSGKRVLILLDDVWKAEHVSALLVGGSGCPALISTRQPSIASDVATSSASISLRRLSDDDAVHLLELIAGDVIREYSKGARAIAIALEGHPLGLQVAARLIATSHNSGLDISGLMARLESPDVLLDMNTPPDEGSPPRTVGAVFKMSTDTLTDIQRLCFAFLSSWEAKPAPLTMKMLEQSWMPFGIDAQRMAQFLVGRGLLEYRDQGIYWMHALLVAHGRAILRSLRSFEEPHNA